MIALKKVGLRFHDQDILKDISIEIRRGDILRIDGPVGSGKSSLLRMISGDQKNSSGSIERSISKLQLAHLPQFRSNPIHLPMTLSEIVKSFASDEEGRRLLSDDQRKKNWNTASGGEKTLCLFECLLQSRPQVILLDEVFSCLDAISKKTLLDCLYDLCITKSEAAVVLVDHEIKTNIETKHYEIKDGTLT